MDGSGFDGISMEAYIDAVRAGAVDPFGYTADELEAQMLEHDDAEREALQALTDEQVDELVRTGASIPPLEPASMSPQAARLRADEAFVAGIARLEAQQARIEGARRTLMAEHMARLVALPADPGPAVKELATMAAVEVGLTQRSVIAKMTESWTIVNDLADAHHAAAAGRITTAHLRVIEQQTRPLRFDGDVAPAEKARVIAELVELAERLSTSQLRQRAKQTINDVLTEPLQVRHDTARQKRKVELFDAGDGMGDLVLHGPILELTAIKDRGMQAARKKPKDDPRTYDQFCCDALIEVMLGGVVPENVHGISPIKAHIAITIPATELLHDAFEQDAALQQTSFPAMLDGKTLVDRDTARRYARNTATWQRLFTDPVSGVPVTADTYRPKAAQKHWLRLRDGGCRGPGCAKPAMRSDLDHTNDFVKGGTTSIGNLGHLCRADHGLKHDTRWRLEQLPGGAMRWTSPIGQVITEHVEPAGPIFTDMPRTPPRPPKLTRSERRKRRAAELERFRLAEIEWQRQRDNGTLPPSGPQVEGDELWLGGQHSAVDEPLPF